MIFPNLFFVLLILRILPVTAVNECVEGLEFEPITASCYKVSGELYSFEQARQYCQARGADMVPVNIYTNNAILANYSQHLWAQSWIGARKNSTTGKYYNLDHSYFTDLNKWAAGEPSSDDNCLTFSGNHNIGIKSSRCDSTQPIICSHVPDLCNGKIYNLGYGTIQSPNYPIQYYNKQNCISYILAPENNVIEIFLRDLKTEYIYDTLEVFEGNTTVRSSTILRLSGNHSNLHFISKTNVITVRFFSNLINTDQGFLFYFNAVRSPPPVVINSGDDGVLTSPNYPNQNYLPSDNQLYFLQVSNNSRIHLDIDDFTTESIFDILEIYQSWNQTDENKITTLSGNEVAPWSYDSSTNLISLKFRTDSQNQFKGWHLLWKII